MEQQQHQAEAYRQGRSGLSYLMMLAGQQPGGLSEGSVTHPQPPAIHHDYFDIAAHGRQCFDSPKPSISTENAPMYPFSLPKFGISSPRLAPYSMNDTSAFQQYQSVTDPSPSDGFPLPPPAWQRSSTSINPSNSQAASSSTSHENPPFYARRPSVASFASSSTSSLHSGGSFTFSSSTTGSPTTSSSLPFSNFSLSLSPQQNLIMQETHPDFMQQQSGLFCRSFASDSPLPPVEDINWAESAMDLHVGFTSALTALDTTAHSIEGGLLSSICEEEDTVLDMSPSLGSGSTAASSPNRETSLPAAAVMNTPKKQRPATADGTSGATPRPIVRQSLRRLSDGGSGSAARSTATASTSSLSSKSSTSSTPATTSLPTKSRQLGLPPADEAFADSLDQLRSGSPDAKPPYLWWTLIRAAILGSPDRQMQMETLCAEISEKFP